MKLLTIQQTILLRLGVLSRPDGQVYLPEAIDALASEFKFVNVPSVPSEQASVLEFGHGRFKNFGIDSLGLYSDGIVLKSATDSAKLDELMNYIEEWARSEFDITFLPSTTTGTIYESNLVVELDPNCLTKIFRKISPLQRMLKDALSTDSNLNANFAFSGLSITGDTTQIENFKPAPFRLERRTGRESGLNQYLAVAPLRTSSHLELLQAMEGFA